MLIYKNRKKTSGIKLKTSIKKIKIKSKKMLTKVN